MGCWMGFQPGLHCLLCAATQAWCALHMACLLLLIADPNYCCLGFCRLCLQTGMWCQLRPLPSNTSQIGMICDQPTAATATVMTYTGSGLAYNGIDLVASGPGLPLLLENTTAVAITNDTLTFVPVEVLGESAGGGWLCMWRVHRVAAAGPASWFAVRLQ
jgi:hypothetical protein